MAQGSDVSVPVLLAREFSAMTRAHTGQGVKFPELRMRQEEPERKNPSAQYRAPSKQPAPAVVENLKQVGSVVTLGLEITLTSAGVLLQEEIPESTYSSAR